MTRLGKEMSHFYLTTKEDNTPFVYILKGLDKKVKLKKGEGWKN